MSDVDLTAWSAAIGAHDDRHWCGKDISVTDVKRAVARLTAELSRVHEHVRAGADALRSCGAQNQEIGLRLDAAAEEIARLTAENADLRAILAEKAERHAADLKKLAVAKQLTTTAYRLAQLCADDARVLAHAYTHDTRPPLGALTRARSIDAGCHVEVVAIKKLLEALCP